MSSSEWYPPGRPLFALVPPGAKAEGGRSLFLFFQLGARAAVTVVLNLNGVRPPRTLLPYFFLIYYLLFGIFCLESYHGHLLSGRSIEVGRSSSPRRLRLHCRTSLLLGMVTLAITTV